MAVLALDTSAAVAVSLVDEDGARLASRASDERRRHAESLAPLITAVLSDAGIERTELTAVVAGTGPAPFTGLRVGLVTARTLALTLGVPVLGVPSLDALAAQAVSDLGLGAGAEILATSDARRKEVYWARYRVVAHEGPHGVPVVERLAGPDVDRAGFVAQAQLSPPEAGGHLPVVIGEGAMLYPEFLPVADDAPLVPDATVLARLALVRRAAGEDQPVEPLYLRRPDVHEPTRVSTGPAAAGGAA
ncbi:tRNA (adenosine(37)-N6)-threonylcarbamoyltransferase complex dimerization subunit type 1 TsaB [Promicromonospora soli]|uniref:tRNA (Adenosine(37)-N6)-threonylcarbamoyltransferase complex dimerization subunit type 1 TsaB n=1 Tax=Promicromonospora soli TaxID=2035533 RepID=A0A919FTJ0_9MICO|nr:tRNA (adenosine(37)-N6)-threonylcarbamoyltransferase complex dimerization subunit type 1 TsaB [Promicromonospora soli]GHH72307.1 tRNA (adenosine(37)-N6)-threonylcarbamoyltransferase complex dimerization subunit type 1 TsaB [Promicromonospora soli]